MKKEKTEFFGKIEELVDVLHEMTAANKALPKDQRKRRSFMIVASDEIDNDPEGDSKALFAVGGTLGPIIQSMVNIIARGYEEGDALEHVLEDTLEHVKMRKMRKDDSFKSFASLLAGLGGGADRRPFGKPSFEEFMRDLGEDTDSDEFRRFMDSKKPSVNEK